MRKFSQFAVFDWSGATGPKQPGIKLAIADASAACGKAPRLVDNPGGWNRGAAMAWIAQQAAAQANILIGLDLSAGFPFIDAGAFFPGWAHTPANAPALWALVDHICANEPHMGANQFVAHPDAARHFRQTGNLGDLHPTGGGRLRITEIASREQGLANPYSCLNLIGAAQVGKSSLTGMRVLHRLRGPELRRKVPVWPFDPVPASGPLIVEIYTSIAARAAGRPKGRSKVRDAPGLDAALAMLGADPAAPQDRYDDHGTDALITAAWLRNAAHVPGFWAPKSMTAQIAATEGWTFGVA